MTAEYVAPARFVLTVLHRKKPDGGANIDAASGERVDGWTTCGRPMVASELWRPVDGRDGDQLCTKCMPASLRCAQAVAEAEGMEATLW